MPRLGIIILFLFSIIQLMDYTMAGVEDILGPMGKAGHLKIRDKYWNKLFKKK